VAPTCHGERATARLPRAPAYTACDCGPAATLTGPAQMVMASPGLMRRPEGKMNVFPDTSACKLQPFRFRECAVRFWTTTLVYAASKTTSMPPSPSAEKAGVPAPTPAPAWLRALLPSAAAGARLPALRVLGAAACSSASPSSSAMGGNLRAGTRALPRVTLAGAAADAAGRDAEEGAALLPPAPAPTPRASAAPRLRPVTLACSARRALASSAAWRELRRPPAAAAAGTRTLEAGVGRAPAPLPRAEDAGAAAASSSSSVPSSPSSMEPPTEAAPLGFSSSLTSSSSSSRAWPPAPLPPVLPRARFAGVGSPVRSSSSSSRELQRRWAMERESVRE
jgi:hypothetical protein